MWFANFFTGLIGLIFIIGSPPRCSDAFNVETKHYAVYRNDSQSMFGFAVSVYRDRFGRGWAIVGAPEAQTSQEGVYRGGAVYKCDIAADDRCTMINFDSKGNNQVRNPNAPGGLSQIDNKTLQWFGATVSSSLVDGGPILACAPRYIWFSVSQPKSDPVGNRREPVGTCWVVSNSFNESQEFSPCRTRYWGYHRQGSCQAGLGGAMSKNGERLFIGAPGSWYWQGQMYSISTAMRLKFVATMLFTPEAEGQAFSQPLNSRARVMYTKEGPATEDDSYMGYSVTTGDFIGNGDSGTAVGVPRGSDLLGKVILFTSNMTNPRNITGEQMGAYFGYAVASGDIDGDGLDDLIVGAPMYTVPDNPEMTIETGRVYVIYQGSGPEKFRKVDTRDGESNRGRFGLSLASLGDIDRDGYGDFAVGAPYGGLRGRGAVYIYHGSPTGVLEKYSQVIDAENLDVPIRTFGFSVAGGLDLDGNRYPDLVVGAYDSGTAVFFRSRPVIKMDSYVSFEQESKLISLSDLNCTLSDGSRVTCFPLKACCKYTGEGAFSRHNFNIQYVLDVKKTKSPRLFFLELEGRNIMNRTIIVEKDQQFCRTVQVYVTPNIRDKLTSLDAEMRMSLDEERYEDNRPRDPKISLRPILGSTTSRKDSLSIRKNCGPDNVCIPDLQMSVTSNVHKYLLGSGERLKLDVLVENRGEDAFESTYNLKLPAGIDYIKVEKIEVMGVPVQCSAPKQSNNNTLRCDIGNPLQKNGMVKFRVLLQPVTSHGMKPVYEFEMDVNTTNPENPNTIDDNKYSLKLPIWIETNLRIDGESKPKDLYYNPDNYTSEVNVTTEAEFGPAMIHNYTIRNQGPSDVVEAEAFLIWPVQTLAGNELLYLLEQPETSGPIACEPANANYLSLKLDQRRRLYHHSDPSGVILDESSSGRTINVQRGFESEKSKLQKEEEIHTGDSSDIQKTRHSSSSSSTVITNETKRFQLSNTGNKPDVLITTYVQNTSGTGSVTTGDLSTGNRGVIFHTHSGGHSDTHGGDFRATDSTNLGTRVPGVESYGTRVNQSFETRWDETSVSRGRVSGTTEANVNESEDRYEELLRRQQEEQRIRQEEAARLEHQRKKQEMLAVQRQREEQERLYYQRQQEKEAALRRQQEEERRRQEAEARRQEEERRRQEEAMIRRQEEQKRLEQERRYGSSSVGHQVTEGSFITGDREETVRGGEFGFQLRNVSSTQELERLFGTLSQSASGYELHNRQGKHFVQFMSRFRTSADRRDYIEFQDGSVFPLQDRFGEPSFVSDASEGRDSRFLKTEGELLVDSSGKGFIVLKDGRRFPLQGVFTYSEEKTYAVPHPNYESKEYSASWNEENSQKNVEREYESRFSSTHEERRRVTGRIYGRDIPHNTNDDEESIRDSNTYEKPRYKRESDMLDVNDFMHWGKGHRKPREKRESDMLDVNDFMHWGKGHRKPRERRESDMLDVNDFMHWGKGHRKPRERRESDMVDVNDFMQWEKSHRKPRDLKNDAFWTQGSLEAGRDPETTLGSVGSDSLCDSVKCVRLRCVLGPLKKDQEVWIAARYRVDARTLNKAVPQEKVRVSTKLVARVTKQPFIGTPAEQVTKSHEIKTNVEPSITPSAPDVIPLWIVVLAACAGAIILLLLIFLLYKCGFFKRNRPTDAPERQPLNRNGHFQQGDDH